MTLHRRLDARLTEIARLEDGWLDGSGTAIPRPVLVKARTLTLAFGVADIALIAPTNDSGITIEWSDSNGGHEVEILPDSTVFLLTHESETP